MIVVWKGYGYLVVVVIGLTILIAQATAKYKPHAIWPRLLVVFAASLVLFALSLLLKRSRVVGRDRAGNEISQTPEHSLYWIPMEYWSVVVLLFGTIIVFAQFGR